MSGHRISSHAQGPEFGAVGESPCHTSPPWQAGVGCPLRMSDPGMVKPRSPASRLFHHSGAGGLPCPFLPGVVPGAVGFRSRSPYMQTTARIVTHSCKNFSVGASSGRWSAFGAFAPVGVAPGALYANCRPVCYTLGKKKCPGLLRGFGGG